MLYSRNLYLFQAAINCVSLSNFDVLKINLTRVRYLCRINKRIMLNSKVKFAVVREDPMTEISVIEGIPECERILLVASGGCSALTIQTMFPKLDICLFDLNSAQIDLVERKLWHLKNIENKSAFKKIFNIEDDGRDGLNACGQFESLFHCFTHFLEQFVVSRNELEQGLRGASQAFIAKIIENPYWPISFELVFHENLLTTMFGPAAVQHAPKGSYATYFQHVIESGLKRLSSGSNYFLHHFFLGKYWEKDIPIYLQKTFPKDAVFTSFLLPLYQIPDLETYDLISLSNILDWCDQQQINEISNALNARCKPGASILYRQLNNQKDLHPFFHKFKFDKTTSEQLLNKDRSLFYNRIWVGKKL